MQASIFHYGYISLIKEPCRSTHPDARKMTYVNEFQHIQTVCNFATVIGTYTWGFSIIIEPFDERCRIYLTLYCRLHL
ncbi:DNA repair helicase XPD [Iris pallida]|uniref:DNA repair helicase XPD n=1 Tax=Iris pallida TaxID=29817 RepID=A0AAX6ERW8_IRIPA|nr:DNA repair helicase XPD [Iris pallida]KAJ6834817.1 DNA repair helicase XPD [Iris pallida]